MEQNPYEAPEHYSKCPMTDWQQKGMEEPPECICDELGLDAYDREMDRRIDAARDK